MTDQTKVISVWSFNALGWIGGFWDWFVHNPEQRSALIGLLTIVSFILAIAISLRTLLKSDRCNPSCKPDAPKR